MITPLPGLQAASQLAAPTMQVGGRGSPAGAVASSFGDILQGYLNNLSTAQAQSASLSNEFMAGGPIDISQVAIALEESGLAMQLLVEVRNKVLDAYETLLRMPV